MLGGRPPNQMQRVTAVMPRPGLGSGTSGQSAAKDSLEYYYRFQSTSHSHLSAKLGCNGKKVLLQ